MYFVTDYNELYRPYDKSGGVLKNADWVKLPAKPRGKGITELLERKRGLEFFAIWCLLLEETTAQKPENRGKFLNHRDLPASICEIAKAIGLKNKTKLVGESLNALVAIGWLGCDEKPEVSSDSLPPSPTKSSVVKSSVVKSNITVIFSHWNSKKQKGWWSHDVLTSEIEEAISERLKKYSVEQIIKAVDNYALVLLSPDYRVFNFGKSPWDKKWTLREFLLRKSGKSKDDDPYFYRFLANNFCEDDYLTKAAKQKRIESARRSSSDQVRELPPPPTIEEKIKMVEKLPDNAFKTERLKKLRKQLKEGK